MKSRAFRHLHAIVFILMAIPGIALAESTEARAGKLNAEIEAAWSTADFRAAQKALLEQLRRFENREIDGKRLVIRKVRAIRSNIDTDSPPRAVVLEDGALGLRLPGEGTWTLELDVTADVNYKFLWFGYRDRIDATIRIKGLSLTVVPDSDRFDLESLFSSKLRIAEIRDAKYQATVLGDHDLIRNYHETIDEKLNAGIAMLLDMLPGLGTEDAKAALASKPAPEKKSSGSPNFARTEPRKETRTAGSMPTRGPKKVKAAAGSVSRGR